jgi:hypothetical protein
MSSYKAWVEAESGLLLGGVKVHRSIPFTTRADAESWRQLVVKGNKDAGRKVGSSDVKKIR